MLSTIGTVTVFMLHTVSREEDTMDLYIFIYRVIIMHTINVILHYDDQTGLCMLLVHIKLVMACDKAKHKRLGSVMREFTTHLQLSIYQFQYYTDKQ